MTGAWRDRAACIGATTVDWFPSMPWAGGTNAAWRANLAAARAICATCPVSVECMTDAMSHWGTGGIWAGTTESQRHKLPTVSRVRPHVARCGTDGGYTRHRRVTGTEPCQECRDAHAIAHRVRKFGRAVNGA